MSQTVNLDTKFSSKVDQAFTLGSLVKGRLSSDNEFVGTRTVKIHTINTIPLNDYNRGASSNRYGAPVEVGDTVEEMTMSQDKSFSGIIDKGNNIDQSINKAGKFMGIEMSEMVIPTYDAYCLLALAQKAGTIVGNSAALSETTVIKRMGLARKALLDAKVPVKGRTWYVTTDVFNAIVDSDQFKNLEKLGTDAIVQGQVGEIFGAPVIEVPADIMPANVNFILAHKNSATAPEKISDNKVHIDPPGISGNLCEGRFYYDLFVFGAKAGGVYVEVNTASGKGTVYSAPTISTSTGAITVTSGATAKYTTDGSDPRYSASAVTGAAPTVTSGTVVKAYQFSATGFASPVASATIA